MKWCTCNSFGEIIMSGVAGDDAIEADFAPCGDIPILNIQDEISLDTHYHDGVGFKLFGEKPSDFHTWDWLSHTWIIPNTALTDAKLIQSATLDAACSNEIVAGFDSTALGTSHRYPAKVQDQANLVASVTASLLPNNAPDWTTPFWCEVGGNWSYVQHTADQIQQAGRDGKAAILFALGKNAIFQSRVQESTSIAEVESVIWS